MHRSQELDVNIFQLLVSAFYTAVHFFLCLTGLEILNISYNLWLPDVIILARSGEGQTLVVVTVLLQSVS